MKKSDLKPGYVVKYRNGDLRIIAETEKEMIIKNTESDLWNSLKFYNDDLTHTSKDEDYRMFDIVEVYGFGNTQYACEATTKSRTRLWKRKDEEELSISESTMLNDLAKEIHENAKAHGWYDDKRSFGEIVALCHSELSEALEEYRSGKPMAYYYPETPCKCNLNVYATDLDKWHGEKLEGIATEMIDCLIRILDWCGSEGIDVDKLVRLKHEYNKSRPYKHGGKVI